MLMLKATDMPKMINVVWVSMDLGVTSAPMFEYCCLVILDISTVQPIVDAMISPHCSTSWTAFY